MSHTLVVLQAEQMCHRHPYQACWTRTQLLHGSDLGRGFDMLLPLNSVPQVSACNKVYQGRWCEKLQHQLTRAASSLAGCCRTSSLTQLRPLSTICMFGDQVHCRSIEPELQNCCDTAAERQGQQCSGWGALLASPAIDNHYISFDRLKDPERGVGAPEAHLSHDSRS